MLAVNPDMIVNDIINTLKNRSRQQTYADIASATDVDAEWLRKLVLGRIKHPPFDRVCRLYCHIYKTTTINL